MPITVQRPGIHLGGHEFLAVGHVTIDRFADGREQLGGSALYSAVQAARCGLHVAMITAGEPAALGPRLAPFAEAIDIVIQPDAATTTLLTVSEGSERRQTVLAHASPVRPLAVSAAILHLAPVLREISPEWSELVGAELTGITPQGLVRGWDADGAITLTAEPGLGRYRADLAVLSDLELPYCGELLRAVLDGGGSAVITRGARPAEVRRGPDVFHVEAVPSRVRDDLGLGDVFAAALLIALRDGLELPDAVRFGHAAASLRMRRFGPGAIASRAEIEALHAQVSARRPGAHPA